MVCIVVLPFVVIGSGPERADALGRVRVDARCVLLAIERDAIELEGKGAVAHRTLAPPRVDGPLSDAA